MCSKYDNQSGFNSQHNLEKGDLYGHFMSTTILTLMMNKSFIQALRIMREVAVASI